jgi:diguanylate cyclase (GGDEF)-like protein
MTLPDDARDSLTGLLSRIYAVERLYRILLASRGRRDGQTVGIILADIFNLRRPHELYGHPAADDVIRDVGRVVQSHAGPNDLACRYGGDEFLLIMPGLDLPELRRRAEALRLAALEVRVYEKGEARERMRLSTGVALWPPDYRKLGFDTALNGFELLMQIADRDLQRSRQQYLENPLT